MKKEDLEGKATALLRRLQQHSQGQETLNELEIRRVLKEIQAIGKMNLASSLSHDALQRVDNILKQAVAEAQKNIASKVRGRLN